MEGGKFATPFGTGFLCVGPCFLGGFDQVFEGVRYLLKHLIFVVFHRPFANEEARGVAPIVPNAHVIGPYMSTVFFPVVVRAVVAPALAEISK